MSGHPAAPRVRESPARRWLAGALMMATGALAGCGALMTRLDQAEPGADASAQAAPAAVELTPLLLVEVQAPEPLKALLLAHLDLSRLQRMPAGDRLSGFEIARLVGNTPAQVRDLLQTEGYFDPQVQVETTGLSAAQTLPGSAASAGGAPSPSAQPEAAATTEGTARPLPRVRVTVEPGPRVNVERLTVELTGPVRRQAEAGDALARRLIEDAARAAVLQPGRPFRNPDWSDSKQQVLARLRASGYASASLARSRADIQVPEQRAQLAIEAESGPLYRSGPIVVEGLVHQDARTVLNLAGFEPGAPLTDARLLDYQERLQKAGLYQSAAVGFDPVPERAEATPVQVRLAELPLQQATVGLGHSANTGPRATLEHIHRRPFDWRVLAKNSLEWGRDRQAWTGDFQSHPGRNFYRNLVGVQIERELSDSDVVLSQSMRIGRTQDTPRQERLYYLELLHSRTSVNRATAAQPVVSASALTANAHGVWRALDSVLLPTRGHVLSLQLGAGLAASRNGPDGPIGRAYARFTGYLPIAQTWYGQARLELGQVFKADAVTMPDPLGFRAGGDDSVRGYEYRSLAPLAANGQVVSGDRLMTASVELARPISAQMPQVWGAVFADAGRAANRWSGFRPALGYGVGVRWRSPVGPLRADLAWGDEVRRLRLHLSVGIAF